MATELVAFDPETGAIALEDCPRCEEVKAGDVENLQRLVTKQERQIAKLKKAEEAARQGDPRRKDIIAIIQRWKEKTGHPRANANAADRFDVIKARIDEGYSFKEMEFAVDGIAAYPYVVSAQRVSTGPKSRRYDCLVKHALKSGSNLERFANLGYEARKVREDANNT
jgi:hypothetical protein